MKQLPPKAHKLKVWIAGASGFCGRGTIDILAQSPDQYEILPHIRPCSRRFSKLSEAWQQQGLQVISVEWSEVEVLFKQHKPDVVISALGTTKKHARTGGGSYQDVDEGLNLRLIEWTQKYSPQSHLIYISSMGVEWGRWNAYLRARMHVEQALHTSSLSYTIIRPGLLSGASRDEKRTLESISAVFSHALTKLYTSLGLKKQAYKVRPLDAPEMGSFIKACIDDFEVEMNEEPVQGRRQKTYELSQLYERLEKETDLV
jgi:nucleoside-diphosphate-sugar epimerase